MSKKQTFKPSYHTREGVPIPEQGKNGVILLCPFCTPHHALIPGIPSPCGTKLHVTAVQQVISARTARLEKLVCVKCRETGGGEMVRYLNGYIHVKNCAPNVRLLTEIPKYSKYAEFVFKLPEKVRSLIEKRTGVVQVVHGLTSDGEETGQVEGYFFARGKATQNG